MFFTRRGKGGRGSNPCENIQPKYFLKDASVLVHEGVPYHRKITCNRTFYIRTAMPRCLLKDVKGGIFPQDGLSTWHWYWSNTPVLYLCQCCHHQHLFSITIIITIDTEFWPPPQKCQLHIYESGCAPTNEIVFLSCCICLLFVCAVQCTMQSVSNLYIFSKGYWAYIHYTFSGNINCIVC